MLEMNFRRLYCGCFTGPHRRQTRQLQTVDQTRTRGWMQMMSDFVDAETNMLIHDEDVSK